MSEITSDRFLGGQIVVRQPSRGFRAGLDAVMLAAAVPASSGECVLELGSGCGTATLCLAARVKDCSVTGVEIDHELVDLARDNARSNGMEKRVSFVDGDALSSSQRGQYAHVFANPPFHERDGQASPNFARALATHDKTGLASWIDAGMKRLLVRGTFTVIARADRLRELLAAAPETGVSVFPLWPRSGVAAKRVIVQLRKGALSPTEVLSGLVLHKADGSYTHEADAVLLGQAALCVAGH